ncbi:MAG: DUF2089 domain-containing protein [Candidatus Brocadiae bacterium]|nr:DUF2089 domain-containing protein [Candidatus Brocadiia bacterium]
MNADWQELVSLTRGAAFAIERVRIEGKDVAIEGRFDVPPLARLASDDQVFVMAFVRSHGSIKRMEELFGVSYPTVKNRLNRIAEQFEFAEIDRGLDRSRVLTRLERGEISAAEALKELDS